MWKDLSEHKPNIWLWSILQTTGPLWLLGMKKHQGRPHQFQQCPSTQKEKMNWKKLFLIPHKALVPSYSQVLSPDPEESLLQETSFLSRLSALPSQGQKLILDEVPLTIYSVWNWHTFYLGHTLILLAPSSTSLNSNHYEISAWGFFRRFWTSNWTAFSQAPRMAAGVNGKFNIYFNKLVVMVKPTQIRSSLAFMLVILIFAWSYTRMYRYWITCNKQTKTSFTKTSFVYSLLVRTNVLVIKLGSQNDKGHCGESWKRQKSGQGFVSRSQAFSKG